MTLKGCILTTIATVMCVGASAHELVVDEIVYSLKDDTTATVVDYHNTIGNIKILDHVSYNGLSYTVNNLAANCFEGCNAITSVSIPSTISRVGYMAFKDCNQLSQVNIEEGVAALDEQAFAHTALTSVHIPSSTTSVGTACFAGSPVKSITVDSNNHIYDSRDNCNAIIETATNTLIVGCLNTAIPQGVTTLGQGCFAQCTGLISTTLPVGLRMVEAFAFDDCSNFATIGCPTHEPPALNSQAFNNLMTARINLIVPRAYISAYTTAETWQNFNIVAVEDLCDVNKDGTVDVTDVNIAINDILCLSTDKRADVNGDKLVDVTDVNMIISSILKIE